jgi:hypothetical protein
MAAAALPSTAQIEMRSGGAATNAGIWDSANPGGGGTDYSQRDTPIISRTNFTCATGGTTLVTATAATFTAAMKNNWIYLSGTHFVTARYKLVAIIDEYSATLCADPTDGTNGSAGTGNVGGGIFDVTGAGISALGALLVAGNIVYWEGKAASAAVWAFDANWTVGTSGTNVAAIVFFGYFGDHATAATGTNRPRLNFAARTFVGAVYWNYYHLDIISTVNACWTFSSNGYSVFVNCRFASSGAANATPLTVQGSQKFIACEFTSPLGYGLSGGAASTIRFIGCRFHDSLFGAYLSTGTENTYEACLFEACGTGINGSSGTGSNLFGCTIVNCGTGVLVTSTGARWVLLNNIIAHCTTGLNWSAGTTYTDHVLANNNFFGNVADVAYITKAATDTAYDPAFQGLHEWTDLACADHTTPHTVTSAAGGFSARLVAGDWLWIETNASNWVSGAYRVVAVGSDTSLTLFTDPTNGSDATAGHGMDCNDARLGTASACLAAGLGLALGVGAASTVDQGAWQKAAGAGGGGEAPHLVFGLEEYH